jgi:proliferating cell nuclear antigen PCNA
MFEAKINDPKILKNGIAAVYELVKEETSVQLSNDGIMITAMDPAQVSMVIFRLLTPAFETYKLDKEGVIGIDMERLNQVLKQVSPDDKMTIKVDGNMMKITCKSRSKRTFSIPLMELNEELKKPPSLEFTTKAVIASDVMEQAINDSAVVSDSLILDAQDNMIQLLASGDLGKVETKLEKGDDSIKELNITEKSRARYAVDYLKKIMKGSKITNDLQLNFRTDYPLQVDFALQDLVKLSFVLAPRVETE